MPDPKPDETTQTANTEQKQEVTDQKQEEKKTEEIKQETTEKEEPAKKSEQPADEGELFETLKKHPEIVKLLQFPNRLKEIEEKLTASTASLETLKAERQIEAAGIPEGMRNDFRRLYPEATTPEKIKEALMRSPHFKPVAIPVVDGGGNIEKKDEAKNPYGFDAKKSEDPAFIRWLFGKKG